MLCGPLMALQKFRLRLATVRFWGTTAALVVAPVVRNDFSRPFEIQLPTGELIIMVIFLVMANRQLALEEGTLITGPLGFHWERASSSDAADQSQVFSGNLVGSRTLSSC